MSQIAEPFGAAETVSHKELLKGLGDAHSLQSDPALKGARDQGKHVEN